MIILPNGSSSSHAITKAITAICATTCALFQIGFQPPSSYASTTTELLADTTAMTSSNTVRFRLCEPTSNCVSSNYREPPNRYVSPLSILKDRDVEFNRAVRDLTAFERGDEISSTTTSLLAGLHIVEIIPKEYYIHATVSSKAPPGSLDDVELFFTDGGIVNTKCNARVALPPPPFCIKKGCINANQDQRERVKEVGYLLGLPPSDQKQMQEGARWTPIFFNADRVPDMLEYDDFD